MYAQTLCWSQVKPTSEACKDTTLGDDSCFAKMLEGYQNTLNASVGLNDLFSRIWQEGSTPQTCFNILIDLPLSQVFRINQLKCLWKNT